MKARILLFLILTFVSVGPILSWAQAERPSAENSRTLDLVDHLKEIIQRVPPPRTSQSEVRPTNPSDLFRPKFSVSPTSAS